MAENSGHNARQRSVQSHVLHDWQSGQFDVEESVLDGSWRNRSEVGLVKCQRQNITHAQFVYL